MIQKNWLKNVWSLEDLAPGEESWLACFTESPQLLADSEWYPKLFRRFSCLMSICVRPLKGQSHVIWIPLWVKSSLSRPLSTLLHGIYWDYFQTCIYGCYCHLREQKQTANRALRTVINTWQHLKLVRQTCYLTHATNTEEHYYSFWIVFMSTWWINTVYPKVFIC